MVERPQDVVTSPERRAEHQSSGAWDQVRLVDRVRHHARTRPTALAVVDRSGARRHDNAGLLGDALKVAVDLRERGVEAGDVVSVQLPSCYEFVVAAVGILLSGAVVNPLLPNYRRHELAHILATARSRVLFTPLTHRGFDHAGLAAELAAQVETLGSVVRVDVDGAGAADDLGPVLVGVDPTEAAVAALPDRPASAVSELMFTSGTEAAPKAIMHTEQTTNFSARTAFASLGMSDADVVWMPSPLGHSTGLNYGARFALYHGLPLVLQDRWDAEEAARTIAAERCSYTLAATTFLHDLVRTARDGAHDLSSMRRFGCGGAPVPAELVSEAADHGIGVLRLYGSTEALVATWNRPGSPADRRRHTDGIAVDDVEVSIRDEDGRACAVGVEGEIWTRGPNTCVGFFEDPVRTAATFTDDGWVRSGDLAVVDAEGYLSVIGRRKEIIIRGGMNIAPREVEDAILTHPDVEAVAVVGLPDERMGETLCAVAVVRAGAGLALDALVAHLEDRGMARYKLPQRLEVVDALPMTASGKVQKFRLSAMLEGAAGSSAGASR